MADINPISSPGIAVYARRAETATNNVNSNESPTRPAVTRGDDAVQLSTHARFLSRLQEIPEVRQSVVDRVRDEIDAGIFENPERINGAVDGLLEDLL